MAPNRDLEYLTFACENDHSWVGTFVPNTPPEIGTLVGSWKCPKCNELGLIKYITCPDTIDKDTLWLIPLPKESIENNHLPIKGLLDVARQYISDIIRIEFNPESVSRLYELRYNTDLKPKRRIALTMLWQLQDILDLIESMEED